MLLVALLQDAVAHGHGEIGSSGDPVRGGGDSGRGEGVGGEGVRG